MKIKNKHNVMNGTGGARESSSRFFFSKPIEMQAIVFIHPAFLWLNSLYVKRIWCVRVGVPLGVEEIVVGNLLVDLLALLGIDHLDEFGG